MTDVEGADIKFDISDPPKSCLGLLKVLRELERFVVAKISWRSSWPPVDRNRSTERRLAFPLIKYVGQTQTIKEKLLAEHQARCDEFSALHEILSELFNSVDLLCPCIPSFDSTHCELQSGKIPENVYRARDDAYRFWIGLASDVQTEVFNRKELVSTWIPQSLSTGSGNETSSAETVYPHFPVRSVAALEKWLNSWIQRCSLPESPKPSFKTPAPSRSEPVIVPDKRPPFHRPVEEEPGRCSFDDALRELRNCYRTLLWLGIRDFPTWENDPPSFLAAEDRLIAMTEWMHRSDLKGTINESLGDSTQAEKVSEHKDRNDKPEADFVFRLKGNAYHIKGYGEEGYFPWKSATGLHDLYRLVQSPGEEVPMSLLDGQAMVVRDGGEGSFKKQPVADDQAVREISEKWQQLHEEIENCMDSVKKSQLVGELKDLETHTVAMFGRSPNGKRNVRNLNDKFNNMRSKISGRIDTACKSMESEKCPKLAEHFKHHCSAAGDSYVYNPGTTGPRWTTY